MPAKSPNNIFYAQSGGVTAVINASACGVIETARQHSTLGTVFAGRNGIIGVDQRTRLLRWRSRVCDHSCRSDRRRK